MNTPGSMLSANSSVSAPAHGTARPTTDLENLLNRLGDLTGQLAHQNDRITRRIEGWRGPLPPTVSDPRNDKPEAPVTGYRAYVETIDLLEHQVSRAMELAGQLEEILA